MVNKKNINQVAERYLNSQIMNAGARTEKVYEFIDSLLKVPGLERRLTLIRCRKLGRLEKWANRRFSDKGANINFVHTYNAKEHDAYSIVEHVKKESGLDFTNIEVYGKDLGALLKFDVGFDSYASLWLDPFKLDL